MRHILTFLCVFITVFIIGQCEKTEDCVSGPSTWYTGTRNVTASGKTCQRWDSNKPHKPKHTPFDGADHNYCRNPDNDLRGTWCYTTHNETRWEYCNITKCPDDSLVIWTSYNSTTESSYLLKIHADPEIVRRLTDTSGSFNVSILIGSNRSMTEFWALAADYQKKSLYYTDYRSEYVAVYDMEKETSTKYFEGMAHGIECLAFDWKTSNLYWTDSEFKWVMASDESFSYYAPVYRTAPDPAYGLAIHSVKRLLIFSTYKALGSKIIQTDMAGKNEKTLFSFPHVFDVTGLVLDYTDDRLYWTDFTGYGGMIISSKLDGTNRTQHNYRGGSIFWGVAAYMDYLYVSDVHARYSMTGDRHYSVWILTKWTKQIYRYTLGGKPRGIAVYSQNEEFSLDKAPTSGECDPDNPCHHICLPRINATRECACSLGYHYDPTTNKCKSKLVEDKFLLVADAGQGKVFQIPISTSKTPVNASNYSIVPLGDKWKATTVAVDHRQKYLYWSDKKKSSVSRASVDGSRYNKVASSYANSIIVDPHTGQLFYSDNERDTIMVSNGDGNYLKTIVKPDPSINDTSSIRMIVQDIKYKYIYWTDTFSKEDEGKVFRCRYDGSKKEIVLDNLNWPHAITIDYKKQRLYVAEAKNAIIYEIELESIKVINNTSPTQKHYKQYDVSAYISRVSPYIIDLKIHEDIAYVVDGKSSRLEKFNITEGVVSMNAFGPAEFFRVTTLSVYDNTFFKDYIKPATNPCENRNCRQMCVPLSETDYSCICEDGKKALGDICVTDSTAPSDTEPPQHSGCPGDQEITLPTCADSVTFAWTAPTWTDDRTAASEITVVPPARQSPTKLAAGVTTFTYIAADKFSNRGYCRFTVTVRDNQCRPVPNARTGMKRTVPTCQNREGSSFNVTCVNEGDVIWAKGFITGGYLQYSSYQVYCSKSLIWTTDGIFHGSDCRPPPTPKTTAVVPIEISTTKGIPDSPNKTPSIAKAANSSIGGTGTKGPVIGAANQSSAGISSGVVAVISVLVVVLVIIIIVVIVIVMRNRPSWSVTRFSFPVFWKSNDDDDCVKMETSSGPTYQIMT